MYSPIRHQRRLDLQPALPAALGSLDAQGEIAAQKAIISANFLEFSSFFHGTFEVSIPSMEAAGTGSAHAPVTSLRRIDKLYIVVNSDDQRAGIRHPVR